MRGIEFRLACIEPPNADAMGDVVLTDQFPDVFPGGRVRGVIEADGHRHRHTLVATGLMGINSLIARDEQASVPELWVVLRERRHSRPDGNHQLNAELSQLVDHRLRVGPFLWVKAIVAHRRPVEVVRHDHRQRQVAPGKLARDFEQFFLCAVSKFRLPESAGPGRQFRDVTRRVSVRREDGRRCLPGGDPVVDLTALADLPAGGVNAELDPADAREVPQEAVPAAREYERDVDLTITLDEIEAETLQVQPAVSPLAHPEQKLAVVRRELLLQFVVSRAVAKMDARARRPEVLPFLPQQFLAGRRVEEGEAYIGDRLRTIKTGDNADLAVSDHRRITIDNHGTGACAAGFFERAVVGCRDGMDRRSHPEAVRSPRLNANYFVSITDFETVR